MSTVRDAINAVRQTLLLAEKVQQLAQGVTQMTEALTDHERRLIRLETRWETAIELVSVRRAGHIQGPKGS